MQVPLPPIPGDQAWGRGGGGPCTLSGPSTDQTLKLGHLASHWVKELCSHRFMNHSPLEKASSLNKCPNAGRMAWCLWPRGVPAYRAPPGVNPGALADRSRIPSVKRHADQRTHKCSVGSTPRCCSFPFGILWSITIVSVFAKQNPLDLMISENESNR